jgi:hypothetical protein
VGGEILRRVALRVGVEVYAPGIGAGPGVDPDGEVLYRPGGNVARRRAVTGEAQLIVEGHDVHDRTEQPVVAAEQAQVPPQLLVPVALVGPQSPDLRGDSPREVQQAVFRGDRHAQRHYVHRRARDAQGDRAQTAHYGQAEGHLGRARLAVQVGRHRGDHDVGPAGLRPARRGVQRLHRSRRQDPRPAREAPRHRRESAGEAYRLGPAGEASHPELAVQLELFGVPVGRILSEHVAQRAEGAPAGVPASGEGRVDLRHPAGEKREAVAVQRDVVGSLVPEVVVRS